MTAPATAAALCQLCDDEIASPNVEAFEVLDMLLCDHCAADALLDHCQFGAGA